MNVLHLLRQHLAEALSGLVPDPGPYADLVKPTQDARHGDYQANCAMPLARVLPGQKPPQIARTIVERLPLGDLLEAPDVAGPGFINLRLKTSWLAARVQAMAGDDRLGIPPATPARTWVIDYSSPNVAKPMHVGHLRSSIIGEALVRLLRFLGHKVITDNHLGDWGGQFGMLLYGYKHFRNEESFNADPVRELARIYVEVRGQIAREVMDLEVAKSLAIETPEEAESPTAEACRQETGKLHAGDPENVALWQRFMPSCLEEIECIYRRLDIHFDHVHGESFYQPFLAGVVQDLMSRGIARESLGSVAVFFAEQKDGSLMVRTDPLAGTEQDSEEARKIPPAHVRYRNGAYTYTTSDLATIRYRVEQWHPDAILYVVGTPQALHFKHLFAIARAWGYDKVELEHVAFGSVLNPAGKVLKTREGGTPLLEDLLNEAIAQAEVVFNRLQQEAAERGEEPMNFSPEELRQIYETVGIGAVKYADLSQNRLSDYRFDAAKMTATEGNTATYMQYAYTRNRSIFRKGGVDPESLRRNPPLPILDTPYERALALALVRFPEALDSAVADHRPNQITAYLWDLAKTYSSFNPECPVLKAPTPELRQSRLLLCDVTARVIQKGLELLGIRTLERM